MADITASIYTRSAGARRETLWMGIHTEPDTAADVGKCKVESGPL